RITRIAGATYNKRRYLARLLWFVRMNLRLVRELMRDPHCRNADILFTGSPPFMLFFVCPLKWIRGARLIYRTTDFYPEVIIAELGRRPLPMVLLERLTWALRRQVDRFEVLGEDQRRLLLDGGIAAERITLMRDMPPIPITGDEHPLPCPH